MDAVETLFGAGDGMSDPWHAYYECQSKEVSQETLNFLHDTAGLRGTWHESNGCWMLDLSLWAALLQYIGWCHDKQLDFKWHVTQVSKADPYYCTLVSAKMAEFGA